MLPVVSFSNEELNGKPEMHPGDMVPCNMCGGEHPVTCSTGEDGKPSTMLMFYRCGDTCYLAAVAGKSVLKT